MSHGKTALGGLLLPHGDEILRAVTLVEEYTALERLLAAPLDQLVQAGASGLRARHECGVGEEEDALSDADVSLVVELVHQHAGDLPRTDVLQVPLGVVLQVRRR